MESVELCKEIINFSVFSPKELYTLMSTLEKIILNGQFAKMIIKALFQEQTQNHPVNNILKENFIEYKIINFENSNQFTNFYDEVFELICIGCVLEVKLIIYIKEVVKCSENNKKNDCNMGIDTVD